jgi:hypothetical protein
MPTCHAEPVLADLSAPTFSVGAAQRLARAVHANLWKINMLNFTA